MHCADLQAITNKISVAVTDLLIHVQDLETAATRLKFLDPVNATPSYHKDSHGMPKYLYLIHPQKNGERIREYIGSKPHKIDIALGRVHTHKKLVQVLRQAADIRTRLDLVARYLAAALRAAEGGEV